MNSVSGNIYIFTLDITTHILIIATIFLQPSKIRLSDIFFYDIKGTTSTLEAINIKCSSIVPCENVHLHNIHLTSPKGPVIALCTHAKTNVLGIEIPGFKC